MIYVLLSSPSDFDLTGCLPDLGFRSFWCLMGQGTGRPDFWYFPLFFSSEAFTPHSWVLHSVSDTPGFLGSNECILLLQSCNLCFLVWRALFNCFTSATNLSVSLDPCVVPVFPEGQWLPSSTLQCSCIKPHSPSSATMCPSMIRL